MLEPQDILFQPRHLFLDYIHHASDGNLSVLGKKKFQWEKLEICLFASLMMLISMAFIHQPCTWRPLGG